MSSRIYRYNKIKKPHHYKVLAVVGVTFVLLGIVGALVLLDIRKNQSDTVAGPGKIVGQVLSDSVQRLTIDQPTYTMELPGSWKELKRVNNDVENSVSWISTTKGDDNRWITLYVDRTPPNIAVNKLLPVRVEGNRLIYGNISDNCAGFTKDGTFNAGQAVKLPPTMAKWQGIDFLCNLPRVVDNETGTGTQGDGLNTTFVTGPKSGKHRYFFVYTDRNIQAKNNVFLDAVDSFRAK